MAAKNNSNLKTATFNGHEHSGVTVHVHGDNTNFIEYESCRFRLPFMLHNVFGLVLLTFKIVFKTKLTSLLSIIIHFRQSVL